MTTPEEKSPEQDMETKIKIEIRHRMGITSPIANNTPYRQLQHFAKMCRVPCNLKKDTLKMVIEAKINGNEEEVKKLLKQVRDERLLRKKQRAKALEESKALEQIKIEENNNGLNSMECQENLRRDKVKELVHNMIKMRSARNVTIQKSSTHTRYRALITPGYLIKRKRLDDTPSSTCTANTMPQISSCNPTVIKYAAPNTANIASNEANTSSATETTVSMAKRLNNPPFGQNYKPNTAVTVRETLLQQYQKNPVCYKPAGNVVKKNWSGGNLLNCPKTVATGYKPLPSFNSISTYNNQLNNYPQPDTSNQLCITDPQTSRAPLCQSKPILNLYQADEKFARHHYYGGFQNGIQGASAPLNMNGNFLEVQRSNYMSSDIKESSVGLQSAYSPFTTVPKNEVLNQTQLPTSGFIQDKISKDVVGEDKFPMGYENGINTDLSLLANMAMRKAQEVIDGARRLETRSQNNNNNGLLMIGESNGTPRFGQDEVVTYETKPLVQDIPTWNNFLENMSNNLSPGVTNEMVHNNDIISNADGSYLVNLTDGKCSFAYARAWLKHCPKKLCFIQLVDGRLFFIRVIGNFDSMQVIVYVQYVNDYFSWRSHVALEVLRADGLPFQFQGEVLPLTYNPIHIISQRNCFVFNMNLEDFSKNIFRLHTTIVNYEA